VILVVFEELIMWLLCGLCCASCRDIGCELYVDHYCRDVPELHCIRSAALPAIAKGFAPTVYGQIRTSSQALYRLAQKKWNIHALRRYLLNTGFVFIDH